MTGDAGTPHREPKDPHYLPHLTWPEVKQRLAEHDLVILPFGALEQHGPALPLGTDTIDAVAVAREAARRVKALCAPVLWPGLSAHHMGFPGTITLTEDTFSRVVMEAAACLAQHGARRILLTNGHGGNEATLSYLAHRITQETPAAAMLFGIAEIRKVYLTDDNIDKIDVHAGVAETAVVMYEQPDLVRREQLQQPEVRLAPWRMRLLDRVRSDRSLLRFVLQKLPPLHEASSNGCLTLLDPHTATEEGGRRLFEGFVGEMVAFIKAWEAATQDGAGRRQPSGT
jgi:creatinine amidohydrolase